MASPARARSAAVRLPRRPRQRRHVHEGGQPWAFGARDRLGGVPAEVIAEITPGVARQIGRHAGAARRGEQLRRRHRQALCRRSAGPDGVAAERGAGLVRQQRQRVARARLDADTRLARGDAEHQERVGAVACDQLRQVAVDGGVAGGEDVADQPNIGKCRPAKPREMPRQRRGWIDWCAGEGTEAGDEEGGHSIFRHGRACPGRPRLSRGRALRRGCPRQARA